jgi:glycosyltransferase involved in cell wall biosynthesis
VGSGTRFLSGISVYTLRLANALAERHQVTLITMRRLLPARLYPGWKRVGANLAALEPDPRVATYDGVDWYWLPSVFRAAWLLVRRRPQVAVFAWWTGTVLHSYILLVLVAKLLGTKVVVEFHEIIETGEAGIPLARRYIGAVAPLLMRLADGFAVHSELDRTLARRHWQLGSRRPIEVAPHGPYDHYKPTTAGNAVPDDAAEPALRRLRPAPADVCNLLFFGVIRPYKGLEHLVSAFEAIPESEIGRYWLTVVGETWEGWTLPTELIERSPRRDRISLINRYVTDEELGGYLAGADVIVLPYLRSSISGPLHAAMSQGLPIVMTNVGGNVEAAEGYGGIVLVEPGDPAALLDGIRQAAELVGKRYVSTQSWAKTIGAYERLFDRILEGTAGR